MTTAAGIWLSAAIGVGCGGALYFVSLYTAVLVTALLRYGPKVVSTAKRNESKNENSSQHEKLSEEKESGTSSTPSIQGMDVSLLNSQDLELFEIWKKERRKKENQKG